MFEYLQQLYKNITYINETTNLLGYDTAFVISITQYYYKHNIITKAERDIIISQIVSDFGYDRILGMIEIAKNYLKQNLRKYIYFEIYNPITLETCKLRSINVDPANYMIYGDLFIANSSSLTDLISTTAKQVYFKDPESAEKALQKFKQANVMIFPRLIDQRFKLQPVITDIGEVFII